MGLGLDTSLLHNLLRLSELRHAERDGHDEVDLAIAFDFEYKSRPLPSRSVVTKLSKRHSHSVTSRRSVIATRSPLPDRHGNV